MIDWSDIAVTDVLWEKMDLQIEDKWKLNWLVLCWLFILKVNDLLNSTCIWNENRNIHRTVCVPLVT